jgi:hypothetical protein
MIMEYKKETEVGGSEIIVRLNDDGSETWIPIDLANTDYQEYLKSLDEPV